MKSIRSHNFCLYTGESTRVAAAAKSVSPYGTSPRTAPRRELPKIRRRRLSVGNSETRVLVRLCEWVCACACVCVLGVRVCACWVCVCACVRVNLRARKLACIDKCVLRFRHKRPHSHTPTLSLSLFLSLFLFLSLSLSDSLSRSLTHTHTCTHILTHKLTLSLSLAPSLSLR
jgi:hypothetical protein